MALPPGERLHGYEIVALLGAGGMGEVYRARDTRLNRDVALKILPPQTAGNPQAFARFEREAQAVAALSHPNILSVFDLGRTDVASYVVFELLEGATLRQRLEAGPLPVRKAIDYARQVADGLAAAHSKGIAHRDIKPDNLFVTDDGRIKILDFGLAQTAPIGRATTDQSVTQAPITDAGTVLGTVGYMAPEQVRGQAVDHRADLFALGCVLYEMCTGQRAFKGATPADTMTAVLSSDPPELALSGHSTPPALERIVRRCLEKAPAERFQSARDLSFALDALSSLSGSGSGAVTTPVVGRRWLVPAAAALAALAIGVGLGRAGWPAAGAAASVAGPPLRVEFPAISGGTATSFLMALSPDGRRLAYSDNVAGGSRTLLVRDLSTGQTEPVPGGDNAFVVSWSPRSDELLFFVRRELLRFRPGERSAVPIYSTAENFRGGVWLSDDTVVFALGGGGGLRRIRATGGTDTPVVSDDRFFLAPSAFGARSDYVLVTRTERGSATNRKVVAVRLADGHVTELIDNDASAKYVPGYLLLARPTGLFAARFDEARMTVDGEPFNTGEPVLWDAPTGGTSLAVSPAAGVVAYRPGRDRMLQFEWLDQAGTSLGLVGPPAFYGSFALSPNGSRVIARQINQVGNRTALNLFMIDVARNLATPVSAPQQGALSDPIWTPDGSRILYRFDATLVRQAPSSSSHEVIRKEQILSRRRLARRPLAARRPRPVRRRLRALCHGG